MTLVPMVELVEHRDHQELMVGQVRMAAAAGPDIQMAPLGQQAALAAQMQMDMVEEAAALAVLLRTEGPEGPED